MFKTSIQNHQIYIFEKTIILLMMMNYFVQKAIGINWSNRSLTSIHYYLKELAEIANSSNNTTSSVVTSILIMLTSQVD